MIVHVVGNRPQFIKLAPLYFALKSSGAEQSIIHSGQHYDPSLSQIFFDELNIPKPAVNLGVGSGTHAEITAKALVGVERELLQLKPELVIVYGDTDTTLAAALAASKLHIPLVHVEGGVRTHSRTNPEEQNRIVTDHLSSVIFCPDMIAVENTKLEGMENNSYCTGDIMYDTFLNCAKREKENNDPIILMTWHRQENTESKERMESILNFVEKLNDKVICPMHPRTQKCLKQFGLWEKALGISGFSIIDPVGYLEMVALMQSARLILTDSGGVSKESSFAGAKCLFMVDLDVWIDLMNIGWIQKVNVEDEKSVQSALKFAQEAQRVETDKRPRLYGDGHAAQKMVQILKEKKFI